MDPSCVAASTSSTKLPHAQTHGTNSTIAKLPPLTCAPGSIIPVETSVGPIVDMPHGDIELMQARTNDEPTIHISNPTPQRPHNMRTRAMDGIFKPKTLPATIHPSPQAFHTTIVSNELTYYSQTVKHTDW